MDPFATATEMLTVLRARKAFAIELLELHRKRIARHNPELNAIVEPDFDRARQAAEAADRRRVAGEDAPLLGLPTVSRTGPGAPRAFLALPRAAAGVGRERRRTAPSSPIRRAILAPHSQSNQTTGPSTPASSSPHRRWSR